MEEKVTWRVWLCNKINSWEWVKRIKSTQWYKTKSKKIKDNKEIIFIILGIIVATMAIGKMMDIPKASFIGGDEDAWLGYWGSIVGIMGAYFVLKIQLKSDNKKHKSETVDNTFFNLLNLHNDILKENTKLIEGISKDLSNMHKELNDEQELLEIKEYVTNNGKKLNSKLNELSETIQIEHELLEEPIIFKIQLSPIKTLDYSTSIEKYLLNSRVTGIDSYSPLYGNFIILKDIKISPQGERYVKELSITEQELFEIDKQKSKYTKEILEKYPTAELIESYEDIIFKSFEKFCIEKDKEITRLIGELFSKEEALKNMVIPFEKIEPHIHKVFENHLVSFGYYFRLFHRIVKFLNENKEQGFITEVQLNNYIGILRAMIDEKTMALIYYNATYLPKGENMKTELRKNHFFGKKDDFNDIERTNTFLTNETLLFDSDYDKLKELTKAYK